MGFKNIGGPNELLKPQVGDYFVSYNPSPIMGDGEETALVIRVKGKAAYLILSGDFREAYLTAIEADGFDGALRVWKENCQLFPCDWTTPGYEAFGL